MPTENYVPTDDYTGFSCTERTTEMLAREAREAREGDSYARRYENKAKMDDCFGGFGTGDIMMDPSSPKQLPE